MYLVFVNGCGGGGFFLCKGIAFRGKLFVVGQATNNVEEEYQQRRKKSF